ncbi:tRNA methyltransferase 10 homolog A isoform X2 [Rhipicephalus microplus]|uniref:tRNA methyltransferase 10 homolog A isoform X2 n=1 Tax=Rhipicephalus microplus TaxID=6941 RepID=UPI001887F48F|nr:tRNA methyltransferase 10 homolog A-like isoform X2 [Rhipicephalus microplus]
MEHENGKQDAAFEDNSDSSDVEGLVNVSGGSDKPVTKEFNLMTISELEALLNDPNSTLSKRFRKRVWRRIYWLKKRPERRALEKEKKKRKREAFKSRNGEAAVHKKPTITKMEESLCKIKVAIDLSFDSYMTDKEKGKCRKQVQRCYSLNRRSPAPVQFYLTGMAGSFKDGSMNMYGIQKWDGLCYRLAREQGVQHARLPIDNCLIMKTRQVLTIDQVFTILLNKTQGMTWTDALLAAIPQRKGAKPLDQGPGSSSFSHNSDDDELEDLGDDDEQEDLGEVS